MLVATPSGVSLAPEGGAHQSLVTPLIGMGQDGLIGFEPAYVDELSHIMAWGFRHMQADDGGSVYLRLSTRPVDQPERQMTDTLRDQILAGAYWLVPPSSDAQLAIVYTGAVAPNALEAHRHVLEDIPGAGLLAVTSADRLHADWSAARKRRRRGNRSSLSHIDGIFSALPRAARIVSVVDGHPATLSWLGSVAGHRIYPLGVETFGQSADIPDLYRVTGIDTDEILDACAQACLRRD